MGCSTGSNKPRVKHPFPLSHPLFPDPMRVQLNNRVFNLICVRNGLVWQPSSCIADQKKLKAAKTKPNLGCACNPSTSMHVCLVSQKSSPGSHAGQGVLLWGQTTPEWSSPPPTWVAPLGQTNPEWSTHSHPEDATKLARSSSHRNERRRRVVWVKGGSSIWLLSQKPPGSVASLRVMSKWHTISRRIIITVGSLP